MSSDSFWGYTCKCGFYFAVTPSDVRYSFSSGHFYVLYPQCQAIEFVPEEQLTAEITDLALNY
jgi:hypothetical protein